MYYGIHTRPVDFLLDLKSYMRVSLLSIFLIFASWPRTIYSRSIFRILSRHVFDSSL